jgi:hypothetical protein
MGCCQGLLIRSPLPDSARLSAHLQQDGLTSRACTHSVLGSACWALLEPMTLPEKL